MKTFFDSSAFVKRYIEETGSQDVHQLLTLGIAAMAFDAAMPSVSSWCRSWLPVSATVTLNCLRRRLCSERASARLSFRLRHQGRRSRAVTYSSSTI